MPNWKGIVGRGFRPQDFRNYVATLSFSDWRPQFVVVHNTSAPRLSEWHSHPGEERMRNLESYYRDNQRWSAGPHLFIADDLIWVFTPLTTSGVHSPSWNGVSWGVEMVGEYDDEPFNPGVRENTVDALAVLHAWRGIDPASLHFHKEDPKTTHKDCPGKNVDKADLIARIHTRMASENGGEHQPQNNSLSIGASLFAGGTAITEADAPGVSGNAFPDGSQLTGKASSRTKDGRGSSSTSGLIGVQSGNSIDAVEKLEAMREGKSLGPARNIRQVRVESAEKITIHQADYGWGKRVIPDAAGYLNHPGFDAGVVDLKGEASYFGKYDPEDEGTGSPTFGTVQTDSSVFGVALPKETLLKLGLAEGAGNDFHATPKGLQAMVEVYNPKKRRLVRVPIVDIGPAKSTGRPTDLTVAAAAFLQDEEELKAKGYKMANIQVQIRIT